MSGLLSPIIALLINKSLTTGCFPAEFIVHRTAAAERDGLDQSLTTGCFPAEFIVHRTAAAERDGLDLHASFQLELTITWPVT